MADDLVKRIDSLMVLLNMEREKSLSLGKHIEKLEAALMEIESLANFYLVRKNIAADAMRNIARAALAGKKKDD